MDSDDLGLLQKNRAVMTDLQQDVDTISNLNQSYNLYRAKISEFCDVFLVAMLAWIVARKYILQQPVLGIPSIHTKLVALSFITFIVLIYYFLKQLGFVTAAN